MQIAIIPARGGSRRIPKKNIRRFHGKPIIVYSIETALRSLMFDQVWVTTDAQDIAEIAYKAGAAVIWRPPDMAQCDVGTQVVMANTLKHFKQCTLACCLYATAPMLRAQALQEAMEILTNPTSDAAYVVPVATWLRDPGQFYMGTRGAFMSGVPLIGAHTRLMKIDPATECDINTPEDWERAERMAEQLWGGKKKP